MSEHESTNQETLSDKEMVDDHSSQSSEPVTKEAFVPPSLPILDGYDESFLNIKSVFGFEADRRHTIVPLNTRSDKFAYIAGNHVVLHDIVTDQQTLLKGSDLGGIDVLCVSDDYTYLAIGERGAFPVIRVFSLETKEELAVLEGGAEKCYAALAFNIDSTQIVSCSGFPDYSLNVWNWRDQELLLRNRAFSQPIYDLSFSKVTTTKLFTCGAGHWKIWSSARTFTGPKLQSKLGKFGHIPLSDTEVLHELDDGRLLSGTESGHLILWDDVNPAVLFSTSEDTACHSGQINCIVRTGNFIVTAGSDQFIKLWHLSDITDAQPEDTIDYEMMPDTTINVVDLLKKLKVDMEPEEINVRNLFVLEKTCVIALTCGLVIGCDFKGGKPRRLLHSSSGKTVSAKINDMTFVADETGNIFKFEKMPVIEKHYKFSKGVVCMSVLNDLLVLGFIDGSIRVVDTNLKITSQTRPHREGIEHLYVINAADLIDSPDVVVSIDSDVIWISSLTQDGIISIYGYYSLEGIQSVVFYDGKLMFKTEEGVIRLKDLFTVDPFSENINNCLGDRSSFVIVPVPPGLMQTNGANLIVTNESDVNIFNSELDCVHRCTAPALPRSMRFSLWGNKKSNATVSSTYITNNGDYIAVGREDGFLFVTDSDCQNRIVENLCADPVVAIHLSSDLIVTFESFSVVIQLPYLEAKNVQLKEYMTEEENLFERNVLDENEHDLHLLRLQKAKAIKKERVKRIASIRKRYSDIVRNMNVDGLVLDRHFVEKYDRERAEQEEVIRNQNMYYLRSLEVGIKKLQSLSQPKRCGHIKGFPEIEFPYGDHIKRYHEIDEVLKNTKKTEVKESHKDERRMSTGSTASRRSQRRGRRFSVLGLSAASQSILNKAEQIKDRQERRQFRKKQWTKFYKKKPQNMATKEDQEIRDLIGNAADIWRLKQGGSVEKSGPFRSLEEPVVVTLEDKVKSFILGYNNCVALTQAFNIKLQRSKPELEELDASLAKLSEELAEPEPIASPKKDKTNLLSLRRRELMHTVEQTTLEKELEVMNAEREMALQHEKREQYSAKEAQKHQIMESLSFEEIQLKLFMHKERIRLLKILLELLILIDFDQIGSEFKQLMLDKEAEERAVLEEIENLKASKTTLTQSLTTLNFALFKTKFDKLVGSDSVSYYNQLLKIFNKKKLNDDEDFDLLDFDDDEDFDFVEDIAPSGCNKHLFNDVLKLRDEKYALEDIKTSKLQAIEKASQSVSTLESKLKILRLDITKIKRDISRFETTKTAELGKIYSWSFTRLSRIFCNLLATVFQFDYQQENVELISTFYGEGEHDGFVDDSTLQYLVFDAKELEKLNSLASVHREKNKSKLNQIGKLKGDYRDLLSQKQEKVDKLEEETKRCEDIQILQFGKKIDLESIEKTVADTTVLDLERGLLSEEMTRDEVASSLQAQIDTFINGNNDRVRENTQLLELYKDLLEQREKLEKEISSQKVNVSVKKDNSRKRELENVIHEQTLLVHELRSEIYQLTHKGSYVMSNLAANNQNMDEM
ncbi:hypothetical protein PCE1_003751 [Barthelona sp. PCE]